MHLGALRLAASAPAPALLRTHESFAFTQPYMWIHVALPFVSINAARYLRSEYGNFSDILYSSDYPDSSRRHRSEVPDATKTHQFP